MYKQKVVNDKIIFLFVVAVFMFAVIINITNIFINPVYADTDEKEQNRRGSKVILVLIDRISLEDLMQANTPNIDQLIAKGAVGLMNTNTAGKRSSENTYATIGAGNKALSGNDYSGVAFKASDEVNGENAGDVFYRNTGKRVNDQAVVNLGIPQVIRNNTMKELDVMPGALGQALKEKGLVVGVLGNADTTLALGRHATLLAMDNEGVIPYGEVNNNLLKADSNYAFGIKTDYQKLFKRFEELNKICDLLVIETGDTFRIDQSADYISDERLIALRQQAIEDADAFIGSLMRQVDLKQSRIIIVSPTPTLTAIQNGNTLTPLVIAGKGIEPGLTISGTTRRPGITTNTDIAASIINFLGAEIPSQVVGRDIESVPSSNPLSDLKNLSIISTNVSVQRVPVLQTFVSLEMIAYIISIIIIFVHFRYYRILQYILQWLMITPLSILLLPFINPSNIILTFLLIIAINTILFFLVSIASKNRLHYFIYIYLLTALLLIIDLITGQQLIKTSLLGYDPMIGARFYGIGNEYMGILIGSILAGITMLLDEVKWSKVTKLAFTAGIFLFVTFMMGHPSYGTNIGGTITAVAAFIVVFLKLIGRKISKKEVLIVCCSVIGIIGTFALYDMNRLPEVQTHLGRTMVLIQQAGPDEIIRIIYRKLAMNIKLIKYTIWSRVLITGLGTLALLFYRRIGILKRSLDNHKNLRYGIIGVITTSIVALVVNDSGIVAASTSIIYATTIILYLVIQKKYEELQQMEK